ncbi:hypothetical protein C8D03_4215 [Bosea sp. 124]|nr:hypothetical protein C8D03_4215 [Bosea sp. 124]
MKALLVAGLAFLMLPLLCAAPVAAQGSPAVAADRVQLAACLRDSRGSLPSCIGSIAISCVRAASGDRRAAEFSCARREETVWRERLMQAMQLSGRTLDAGQRSRLAALHLAWEGFIAQKCAFYGATQREGWQVGRQAGCELREVATRALELERVALQQAPTRRPSSPPQIIR